MSFRALRWTLPWVVLIGIVSVSQGAVGGGGAGSLTKCESSCCCNSAPELWVVNSRYAPRCHNLDAGFDRLTYQRWDATCNRFVDESRASFLACEGSLPTLLFSHGNTLTHENAMKSCWKIYQRLKACPGAKRLLFWSWPAEVLYKRPLARPIRLVRKNIRAKYVYAEYQGYYMAKLAQQMSFSQPVTLGGHSYGGLTAICALHYLGGGELNGIVLDGGAAIEQPNLRAAIVSGALDRDAIYPECRYGQALAPVETFYTTYNPRDATLKRWPTHSLRGQQAVGYTGICASRLGPYADKLFQQKLTEDVGRSHYMQPHLASNKMISAICQTAFPAAACAGYCELCSRPQPLPALPIRNTSDQKYQQSKMPVE